MVDFHSILVTSYKLLNCFSLIKNTSFILSTNVGKGDLTYLHGILDYIITSYGNDYYNAWFAKSR